MKPEAWAEQYEAWLDARETDHLPEDDDETRCPMCGAEIDPNYRYCPACEDIV
jgi:uncharacterized OB-fold protein